LGAEERKQLEEYAKTRDLPVTDDRAAARLQSTRVLAGGEQKDAQAKVDAFQTRRHFWKFHVEGFGKFSLREVEQKIRTETEDKFKLYNFLRPIKREAIQLRIEFLQETKRDIQKQIVPQSGLLGTTLQRPSSSTRPLRSLSSTPRKPVLNRGRACPCPSLTDPS